MGYARAEPTLADEAMLGAHAIEIGRARGDAACDTSTEHASIAPRLVAACADRRTDPRHRRMLASTVTLTPPRRGRTPSQARRARPPGAEPDARPVDPRVRWRAAEGGLTLTDIAQRVHACRRRPTHRLLATLEKMGYVYQAGDLGLWYVGLQAFTVGSSFLANRDFVAQSHPYMRRLMEQSGETANLAILDGTEAVFIDQVQCREMMRTIVKLGSRVPLHASGVGKAIFASLPDEQIDAILKVKGLPRITENTITVARDDVGERSRDPPARLVVRRRGARARHALRRRADLRRARGAARRDLARGTVVAAARRAHRQLGPVVAHTAEEMTRRLGGRWPHRAPEPTSRARRGHSRLPPSRRVAGRASPARRGVQRASRSSIAAKSLQTSTMSQPASTAASARATMSPAACAPAISRSSEKTRPSKPSRPRRMSLQPDAREAGRARVDRRIDDVRRHDRLEALLRSAPRTARGRRAQRSRRAARSSTGSVDVRIGGDEAVPGKMLADGRAAAGVAGRGAARRRDARPHSDWRETRDRR